MLLAPDSRVAPKGYAILASPSGAGHTSRYAREAYRLHRRNRAGYSSSSRLALGHDQHTSPTKIFTGNGYRLEQRQYL